MNPGEEPIEQQGLSPMDDVKNIFEQINKVDEEDMMIVGHQPHLGRLISLLIVGSESVSVVAFQQGGVVCLSRDNDRHWSISWMLVPEMI